MSVKRRHWALGYATILTVLACPAGMASAQAPQRAVMAEPPAPELFYSLTEGQNLNAFVREGQAAAHLLLRNGNDPRVIIAFPAGNSGIGIWFDPVSAPVTWTLEGTPAPIRLNDAQQRPLHGIAAVAQVNAPRLGIGQVLLTNVRFLRDYQAISRYPLEVVALPQVSGRTISYARDRIDGAPGYKLTIEVLDGTIRDGAIIAPDGRPIRLRITGATGDTPLTGLTEAELLNSHAAPDPAARHALSFLAYREKLLAGSWRFNTYFGRDTLMSIRLLMPALNPPAMEAGLGAVLARLNAQGEVAHEEGLSEFALIERRAPGERLSDAPTLDYAMIDDDYMLAPVAADFLLGPAPAAEARRFLASKVESVSQPGTSETAGALLVRNLRFVLSTAEPFAKAPGWNRLIAVKAGRLTGEWRDSEEGLGRGRYPYNVNAVFVPAALTAADRLLRAGLLDAYVSKEDRAALARAGALAKVWREKAPALFHVTAPAARATEAVKAYATHVGVPAAPALAALGKGGISYNALSLDDHGAPVPILNSDDGFMLLFGEPPVAAVDAAVTALMRPFPAGLMTDVGLLVANPVLATREVQDRFSPAAYHGAVIWSWQQALFAAGLEHQLARKDLPAATRARLVEAQTTLWRAIKATRAMQSSELWSWAYEGGVYRAVAFGAGAKDVDESNAAQLWSTVYLAVRPPEEK